MGIVETTWNKFESKEEIFNLVRKRTAYNKNELYQFTKLDSLVIMFKHYITFNKPVTYEFLVKNRIVSGYIQAPRTIKKEGLKKIIGESNTTDMFKIII